MIRTIALCRAAGTDPYENLAAEQYLLEHAEPGTCLLYLWQNRNTVVIGRNQNPWQECRCALLEADGGHLARRLSGGGAVFHDLGNLNFTFLMHQDDYDLERQLSVITEACRTLGIPAQRSGRNDITVEGKKFSGNAFYTHQGRSYHHGTLLIDVNMQAMGRYLSPSPAKLKAKGVASVRSRVINLARLCPGLTAEAMARHMQAAFERVYGLPARYLSTADLPAGPIRALAEHYCSWEWLYGRKMAFSLELARRFAWGELCLQIQADHGMIGDAEVYSDAMDWTLAPALKRSLAGCRLASDDLRERLSFLPPAVKADVLALLEEAL